MIFIIFLDRALEARKSPYPIEYRLNEVESLLTRANFPDIEEQALNTKRNLLRQAYAKYCSTLPGCSSQASEGTHTRGIIKIRFD